MTEQRILKPETYAERWVKAKGKEDTAKTDRKKAADGLLQCSEEIIKRKKSGAVTSTIEGFKITVTNSITRILDNTRWATIKESIPFEYRPVDISVSLLLGEIPDDLLLNLNAHFRAINERQGLGNSDSAILSFPAETISQENFSVLVSAIQPQAITVTEILNKDGMKWLEKEQPAIAAQMAPAITEKPGNPAVKVVKVGDK